MTGFSAQWLALREAADHRARSLRLCQAVAARFERLPVVRVTDLGCGSGSNLRALAPHLGPVQQWRLVDHDGLLLQAAAAALRAWADTARLRQDGVLELRRDGRQVAVSFLEADLARDLDRVLDAPSDLVTAAALFDLVSADWIERFTDACVARGRPLYTVLTYDGQESWSPPHPADAAVLAAFHAHQAREKGFGPSAGPRAAELLRAAFAARGWRVDQEASPWQLDRADAALIQALAEGVAQAAGETGRLAAPVLADWLASRRLASACQVGHVDLFARAERETASKPEG